MQDDLARSRKREAFWISLVVHIVLVVLVTTSDKWMPNFQPQVRMRSAEEMLHDRELTYVAPPPDRQKPPEKVPEAKHLSDKNRIATSRNPQPDRKMLDELRAGASRPQGMQQPQPAPQQQPAQQPQQQARSQQGPTLNGLESPQERRPQQSAHNLFSQPMTAGSSISQAARGAARGGYGGGEDGSAQGSNSAVRSSLDILSDTQGVDFGPYLNRVLGTIKVNWYKLCPESVYPPLSKHGKVAIEFAILPDGKVAGMRLVGPSGDVALDRAAWGGISYSNPFPPLPHQFTGPYLALRIHFFYNPKEGEMR